MWVQSLGLEGPLEKEMKPTPIFLPEKSHGQRSLVGCSPRGCKELDMTKQLSTHASVKIVPVQSNVPLINNHQECLIIAEGKTFFFGL